MKRTVGGETVKQDAELMHFELFSDVCFFSDVFPLGWYTPPKEDG